MGSSVASLPLESTSVVVSPLLTIVVEVFVMVPVVNADALDALVVPLILGKDVTGLVEDDGVVDVVPPEVVPFVAAPELVV